MEDETRESARDLAWRAFTETGEIGLYMLYNELDSEENIDREESECSCAAEHQPQGER